MATHHVAAPAVDPARALGARVRIAASHPADALRCQQVGRRRLSPVRRRERRTAAEGPIAIAVQERAYRFEARCADNDFRARWRLADADWVEGQGHDGSSLWLQRAPALRRVQDMMLPKPIGKLAHAGSSTSARARGDGAGEAPAKSGTWRAESLESLVEGREFVRADKGTKMRGSGLNIRR